MITHTDLAWVPEDVARRVIGSARSFAPCIDSLVDDDRATAIAILAAAARQAARGAARHVKSQRLGPAAVENFDPGSWFEADDRAALIAMCARVSARPGGMPAGRFPQGGVVNSLWPDARDR